MKALAAVNIRHYEHGRRWSSTIARSKWACTSCSAPRTATALRPNRPLSPARRHPLTDQGLCGQFNERIVTHALDVLEERPEQRDRITLLSVGGRNAAL